MIDPKTEQRTLNEVLASLGITHRRTGNGYQHEYVRGGRVVFTGTVAGVWQWLAKADLEALPAG